MPGERLFLILDFTHNFKNLYNNFVNNPQMHPPTLGHQHILEDKCIAQFAHLKQLYQIEEGKTLKVAQTFRKVSLNPSSIARTSPQHALGKVFL